MCNCCFDLELEFAVPLSKIPLLKHDADGLYVGKGSYMYARVVDYTKDTIKKHENIQKDTTDGIDEYKVVTDDAHPLENKAISLRVSWTKSSVVDDDDSTFPEELFKQLQEGDQPFTIKVKVIVILDILMEL